jgi:hypothetical protein
MESYSYFSSRFTSASEQSGSYIYDSIYFTIFTILSIELLFYLFNIYCRKNNLETKQNKINAMGLISQGHRVYSLLKAFYDIVITTLVIDMIDYGYFAAVAKVSL